MVKVHRSALVFALVWTFLSPACGPTAIPGVPKATDSKGGYGANRLERLLDKETGSKAMGGNSIDLPIDGQAVVVVQDEKLRKEFDATVAVDIDPDRTRRILRSELNVPSMMERLRQFAAGELAWSWL